MNEKLLEKKLCEGVKMLGGLALKLNTIYFVGMPDRILLLPGGGVAFVELKTTGKKVTNIQRNRLKMLKALGFYAWVVSSEVDLMFVLLAVKELINNGRKRPS
jgi:hypothetical protein